VRLESISELKGETRILAESPDVFIDAGIAETDIWGREDTYIDV
jgi:hypothetical protein